MHMEYQKQIILMQDSKTKEQILHLVNQSKIL